MIFDPIERKNEITIFTEKKICKSGRNTLIEVTAPERQNVRYDTEHYVKFLVTLGIHFVPKYVVAFGACTMRNEEEVKSFCIQIKYPANIC